MVFRFSQVLRRGGISRAATRATRSGIRKALRPSRLEALEDRTLLSASIPLNAASWTPIGPAPILGGQTGGRSPVAGRTGAVAASPIDPNTIYIGTSGGGVWKTTDGGTSWTALTDDQPSLVIGALAIAPSNPNVLYAGTGEADYAGDSYAGHGILKTVDGGKSWSVVGSNFFDRRAFTKIVVDPTDPNTVYAALGDQFATVGVINGPTGIYKSSDGGVSWANTTASINTTDSFTDVLIDPNDPKTLYGAVGFIVGDAADGVYKSTDSGATWKAAGNFPGGTGAGVIRVAMSAADSQTVYATISDPRSDKLSSIQKSTDGGQTWKAAGSPPNYLGTQGSYDSTLAVDPTNASRVYVAGSFASFDPVNGNFIQGTLESIDGGANWQDISIGADLKGPHVDHHGIGFSSDGKLLDTNDGGIWRLDNPDVTNIRWADLNGNLQITQFVGIALHPTDPNIVYGGSQDNGIEKFTDNLQWNHIQDGDGGHVRVDQTTPNTVYHTFFYGNYGFFERSDDGGQTWNAKINGLDLTKNANFYVPYIEDSSNSSRLLMGIDRVYETTDKGENWKAISTPNSAGWTSSSPVDAIAIAPTDPKTIYAAAGGDFATASDLFVTTNGGTSWTKIDIPGASDHFKDIQVDPLDSKTVYVVRDYYNDASHTGHVFKSTDGGQTWKDISGNLPDLPATTFVKIHSNNLDALVVGTDRGVFASYDGGSTWGTFKPGMPNVRVSELVWNPKLNILAAGTYGRGVLETSGINPLTVHVTPPTGLSEGRPLFGAKVATFTDLTGNKPASSYTATIDWGNNNVTTGTVIFLSGNTYEVVGSNTYAEGGIYDLKVTVSDNIGDTAFDVAKETITDAPLIAKGKLLETVEGGLFSGIVATFSDSDPNPTTTADYTATIDWNDGTSSLGTITPDPAGGFDVVGSHGYLEEGSFTPRVTITDAGGARATAISPINVDDAPLSAVSLPFAATEGAQVSARVARFTDADPNGTAADYTATITWGDGSISTGTIVKTSLGFEVNASHTYIRFGQYAVSVLVEDAGGSSATTQAFVQVADAALTATSVPLSAVEGATINSNVATFTDASPFGRLSDYTATIDWGDGTVTTGKVVANGAGGFSVFGTHAYEEGTFTELVTINDVGGASAQASTTVVVADAALTPVPVVFGASEGVLFTGVVAKFADANPSAPLGDFSATIDWGDGTSSTGTVTVVGGQYQVLGSHVFGEGTFPVTVSVSDVGGSSVSIDSTANVPNAPIVVSGVPFSASEGIPFTGVVAHFVDGNPIAQPAEYTVSVDWGDGTTTSGIVAPSAQGGFDVFGSHVYEEGTFTPTVTITDKGGQVVSGSTSLIVADAKVTAVAASITAQEGIPFNGTVATFTDGNPNAPLSEFTATITWGDGTTGPGTLVAQGGGRFVVNGTHAYEEGTFGVTVTIREDSGQKTVASSTVTVADAPLTAGTAKPLAGTAGTAVSGVVGTFTDANPQAQPAEFTATISWGDGSPGDRGIVTMQADGTFRVSGSHTYAAGSSPDGQTYPILVQVVGTGGSSVGLSNQAVIKDGTITAAGAKLSPTEGVPFSTVVATFTDSNPLATASTFTATIDWGDGTTSAGTVAASKDGGFQVTGAHTYGEKAFDAKITIKSAGGSTATATIKVAVPNAPLATTGVPVTAYEGVPFSGTVATLSDGNITAPASSYGVTITLGDGTLLPATLVPVGAGQFRVVGNFTYAAEGTDTLQVQIVDADGNKTGASVQVTIADAPLSASGVGLTAVENQPLSALVANFRDLNANAPSSFFVANVDWGDGTQTSGTVVPQGQGYFGVQAGHTYQQAGSFTIRVTAQDRGGASALATSFISVGDLLVPLTATLTAASYSSPTHVDGVTNINHPTFTGTAEAGSTVSIFGQRPEDATPILLGKATADALGAWTLTTGTLGDGSYTVTGSAVEANGRPSSGLTTLYGSDARGPLVISTTGPHVAGIQLDPVKGQFQVFFSGGAGLDHAAILNAANYSLNVANGKGLRITGLSQMPGNPDGVLVSFATGRKFKGTYVLTMNAGGIRDRAGNVLDERIYTPFPSVNRNPGANYVAQFTTDGRTATGPQPFVPKNEIIAARRHVQFVHGFGRRRR